ncbi:DNA-binding transcriptional regulator, MocR family, contains an aminotransferase domain [Thermomonospora echinospora]|uniref:DNA-binding transcriptional regulator, MocR family, contains an aminotransferase domain n=1 Tax=Thermomonospora echinospora TaxID=1992 RepID=A0A1H6C8P5_9ACTN|nr:PLP-dependent aminotransferase family protein [Thermomonospora echinospora]SEG69350.1 DNA-binding transcriptional regulator, MocR family, contains an aminotransferase domain [Thermomonospora echinospora]
MADYRRVADEVAADITAGRLRPGDRLPTQREFARRRGIAASTAARVYGELTRRGLTVGEVGRGTFVRATARQPGPALAEPADSMIDLELSHCVVPGQAELLAGGLGALLRPDVLESAMRPIGVDGTPLARSLVADLLARGDWRPDPARVLFAGNGRQAIAAAVSALVPPGARLGAEELTYPVLKAIAGRLGVTVVPLAVDEAGLVPEAVEAAMRKAPLKAIYLQPTLHNPLSLTMPEQRRAELAGVLERLNIFAIEDVIWSFLRDDLPHLAALAPEHTLVIDSLSKRLAPGLTLGFAVVPQAAAPNMATALRSGGSTPMRLALDAATRWLTDGVLRSVTRAKQREAAVRQEIAARHLGEFAVHGDPRSFYCWWELPSPWRADTFVAAAARRGIAVTPGAAFTVGRYRAPNAVRLGLASPPAETLSHALATLAGLARSAPDDLVAE